MLVKIPNEEEIIALTGEAWDYEYKYSRGGKTLCTLYLRESGIGFMVIMGKAESEKFEKQRMEFSTEVQMLYRKRVRIMMGNG